MFFDDFLDFIGLNKSIAKGKSIINAFIIPTSIETLFEKANSYHKEKDYYSAIRYYTKVIKLNPSYEQVYFKRGRMNFWLDEYESAISDYKDCLKHSGETHELYEEIAMCYYLLNNDSVGNGYMKKAERLKKKLNELHRC